MYRAVEGDRWRLAALHEQAGSDAVQLWSPKLPSNQRFVDPADVRHRLESHHIDPIPCWDVRYPPLLRHIRFPPAILYARGSFLDQDQAAIGIVGARQAVPDSLVLATRLGRALARAGVTIISGLARGVDAAAHTGALAAGRTIAVQGCGPDRIYPSAHSALAQRIAERGAVLSQFPMGAPPLPRHFPWRNRTLAGLCAGIVVVQAGPKSGALVTARHALEEGREVLACPGPAGAEDWAGCHRLLRDGAPLVETADDVLELLEKPLREAGWAPCATGDEDEASTGRHPIVACLRRRAHTADELTATLAWEPARVRTELGRLEISGQIVRLAGDRFALR